ncbi:aryl-sulfate sulfotransferase [Pontimicrobium sp. MEBiC01747]
MKKILCLLVILSFNSLHAQNTVGVITNENSSYDGLTLFTPVRSTETYLINNCGEVINQWSSTVTAGNAVYLLENGNLLRAGKIANADITFGGVGGKVELYDWDGNLLWEYTYSSPTVSQHHDVFPLPNGNILMLAVTTMDMNEAIEAGRDPSKLAENKLFNEQILELEPVGTDQANVVWEWNIKDHLVQDFDATKSNFGVIADNPQLLDINFLNLSTSNANWLHVNSIQYNETLDQIVLSSRNLSEIFIIDHSTTTVEAASNTGGTYGKGGDFLYRWGNPESHDKGTAADRTLDGQHYPHWIPDGLTDAGKLMIYNNGNTTSASSVDIIAPVTSAPGVYVFDATNGYGPTAAEWQYMATPPTDFFSAILSSGQRLPNGNTLICDGDSGYFFEIDSSNNIVWEYINPDTVSGIVSQGDTATQNIVFRAFKYPMDYSGFTGVDLTPGTPIELNPSDCNLLSVTEHDLLNASTKLYPNPVENILNINSKNTIEKVEVYSIQGQLMATYLNQTSIDLNTIKPGIYLLKLYSNKSLITKKIIKQ